MHRTQIYFDDALMADIKQTAKAMGVSVSAYIISVLAKDIEAQKQQRVTDFSEFAGMWAVYDITLNDIRKNAWR